MFAVPDCLLFSYMNGAWLQVPQTDCPLSLTCLKELHGASMRVFSVYELYLGISKLPDALLPTLSLCLPAAAVSLHLCL